MLKRGDKVGVAVSGGKDSLSLLQVLHSLARPKGYELVALTVDEGVQGYREESIEHADSLAKKLGIEHVLVSYKELYGFDLDAGAGLEGREGRLVLQHVRGVPEEGHRRGRRKGRGGP